MKVADRHALLKQRLASAGLESAATAPTLPRRREPGRAGLSFAQSHAWRYQLAHPKSVSNNLGLMLTFTGAVKEEELAKAFARIVARHEIFRTTYHQDADGTAYQTIHPSLDFPCRIATGTLEEAKAEAEADLARPFDLSKDCPLRLHIVRIAADQVVLTMIFQHILWDGATFPLLSRELEAAYGGQPLTEPALQYADFAEWEQSRLAEIESRELAYWKNRLAAPLPQRTLLAGRSLDRGLTEKAGRLDHRLASSQALMALAARHRVTPFIAFMACWARVLGAEQQDEVTIGTTVLTRDAPGTDGLIGNFANHIVLRLPSGRESSSGQAIAATSAEFDNGFSHRHLPYERLADLLTGQDPAEATKLFDSLVVFIPSGTEGPSLPGCSTRWQRLHNGATQFPLVPLGLEIFVRGRGENATLDVEATYAHDLFRQEEVTGLLARLDATIHDAFREVW
ncbi:condensation domain-containing protein [Rhizobium paknamense]|uniref:Condensation domain-containing protein n=1 Tax=Rhizobium paknamense TaxID=1206817 RepID=A0ABU0IHX5_9HYPH|nr:condensation domain-containing protein [Rhizobium paknamense]MDQ0457781.1 hypothetical protein [Rhizobium paknamense]